MPHDDASSMGASSEEEIPFKDPKAPTPMKEEDDDDDEESEDEYVVEKIIKHAFTDDGVLIFLIKWQGYEKKEDRTWEPEANLSGAKDLLEAYYAKRGGRPQNEETSSLARRKRKSSNLVDTAPGKKRGRKPNAEKNIDFKDTELVKREKQNGSGRWEPPEEASWEDYVMAVDGVEEIASSTGTGEKIRMGYLAWVNGKRTQHPLSTINVKCPQKMLKYYEAHLLFKPQEGPPRVPINNIGEDIITK